MTTQSQTSNEKLLRKKQVADTLACSLRTVDRLANSGRLTRIKCAGVRFRESEVQAINNGNKL
jgi:predicted DNA-binding transcriptional regulator AlpA